MAGEAKAARDGGVAKAFLSPTEEDVAGCKYCRREIIVSTILAQ